MRMMLLCLLLSGCTSPQMILVGHPYIEVSGNIQHRTGASDWALVDGYGKPRDYVGQVMAVAGYEMAGWSAYAGFNHLSLPEYGHDRGLNGEVVGIGYKWRFGSN